VPEDLLLDLNDQQRQAVLCNDMPLLILAGAGSGKTKTLTHKIAYLLSSNLATQAPEGHQTLHGVTNPSRSRSALERRSTEGNRPVRETSRAPVRLPS
jgi:hypothetical protein